MLTMPGELYDKIDRSGKCGTIQKQIVAFENMAAQHILPVLEDTLECKFEFVEMTQVNKAKIMSGPVMHDERSSALWNLIRHEVCL